MRAKSLEWEKPTRWERFVGATVGIGRAITGRVELAGNLAVFSVATIFWLVVKGAKRETLTPAFYNVGVLSLPVVMLTGTFIGMVLAVQSYPQFKLVGLETRIGAAINLSLVKELGPVLAATMLAGMAAEEVILGTRGDTCGGAPEADLSQAVAMIARLELALGLGDTLLTIPVHSPDTIARRLESDPLARCAVERGLQEALGRARAIVVERQVEVQAVAAHLKTNGAWSAQSLAPATSC
jgi:hypothetical protein